jgi:hypothetical protein
VEYITPTEWKFDIGMLQDEIDHLLQDISFDTHHIKDQIAIISRPNALVPLYDGVGKFNDNAGNTFSEVNEVFRGTYLEHIYHTLKTKIPMGRVRLLRVRPGRCYSFHSDTNIRYHLAIQTNDAAFIVYKGVPPYHIPADGVVYRMDAIPKHTAINGSGTGQDRIHVVFNTHQTV